MKTKSEKLENKLIKYLKNEIYFKLAESSVHGVGIFAIKDIPKGTDIYIEFNDDVPKEKTNYMFKLELNKMESIPLSVRKMWSGYAVTSGNFQFIYLPPNYKTFHSLWMNHSDDPNFNAITKLTIKDIKEGEEIFEDYNLFD